MRWYMFGPVILFGQTAAQMVLSWFLTRAKVRTPFRMSSVLAGEPSRPGIYFVYVSFPAASRCLTVTRVFLT